MYRAPFLVAAIAAAFTSGCSSPSQSTGNPFDERIAAPESAHSRDQYPLQQSASRSTSAVILPASGLIAAMEPVEAAEPAAVYAAAPPATPVIPPHAPAPIEQMLPTTSTSPLESAQLAMAEAKRIGANGDQAGMLDLMEQSAYMGNYEALYELARIYQNGIGVPKDMARAIAYLTTADGFGHAESSRVLAWNYLLGNGVPQDRGYAVSLFEKAAAGSLRAKREYGLLLTNQLSPGLSDPAKGLAVLEQAMRAGDAESAFRLGTYLAESGKVAEGEAAKAEALKLGFVVPNSAPKSSAPIQLGARSEVNAEALKQKALAGDNEAIFNYANGLLLGKYPSIEPDFDAYCWFSVASDRGHQQARTELGAIQGVRVAADAKSPGKLDACIADLHAAIR